MAFNILEHLDRLTPDGGSNDPRGDHSFHCPACEAPNFKVNMVSGKWSCFSCDCADTEAGKRCIRDAISPSTAKPPRQRQERQWDYFTPVTLERGQPALTVHRLDDPDQPDGNGWKDGRKIWQQSRIDGHRPGEVGSKVLPYRYAEAQQALDDGAPFVIWAEGEPCVDAIWKLGLPAVTSIGGAGKFRPARDGGLFPADRIVVCPDRDQPGLKHAEQVAAAYPGCQWLYAFPGTTQWNGSCPPNKGLDIADWIAAGATFKQILAGIGPHQHGQHNAAYEPVAEPSSAAKAGRDEEPTMAKRINAAVESLLQATLMDDQGEIDASLGQLYRLGVSRERSQERVLMLWAERHGYNLSPGGGTPITGGRTFGKAKDGAGLRQQLPGFLLDRDLHLVVANASTGKTLAVAEMATVMSARDRGFLDHEAPRTDGADDTRNTVLVIASDGEASAYSMWEAYLQDLSADERGANIEIWAQDDETGEQAWNVSLRNLDRLVRRLDQGDVCLVAMDTANAILRGAGVNTGIGPIEAYLRLLKQIVCRHCPLVVTQHTNRSGTPDIKGIGGHPAFQEVPSVIHMIEAKRQADGTLLRIWHVLKLRGSNYRRFAYELRDGRLVVTEGHLFENCDQQVLLALHKQLLIKAGTTPGELIRATKRPSQSVYNALERLRGAKLVRRYGSGYRLTPSGQGAVDGMRI